MKIVNLSLKVILSLRLVGIVLFYLTGYDSAFEADQLCHSNLAEYENPTGNYGCDHDTETHQWILYNKEKNTEPAQILEKFRYKFL